MENNVDKIIKACGVLIEILAPFGIGSIIINNKDLGIAGLIIGGCIIGIYGIYLLAYKFKD